MISTTTRDLKFAEAIKTGIPQVFPEMPQWDEQINHAPKRKEILNAEEKKLALRNALRYFKEEWHRELILEIWTDLHASFSSEL
jgi:urocanate hydratase